MNSPLIAQLDYVSGYRANRVLAAQFVVNHPECLEDLVHLCFGSDIKTAYKACWVLEQVAYSHLQWLAPHVDFICTNLHFLHHESCIRPMAKIVQLLTEEHYYSKIITLNPQHLDHITNSCFDWLLSDTKVAAKCYSILTLFVLGKHNDWIYPELKTIIEKDFTHQSSAYKAVSKEIMKKIK